MGVKSKPSYGRMPVPKEHGAWALVYGPLAAAALAFASFDARLPLLVVASTALFMSHEPLSRLARASAGTGTPAKLADWKFWSLAFLVVGILSGACLVWFWDLWTLPFLAAVMGLLLAVHLRLVARRVEREVAGELLGVAGLTAGAPITYFVFHQGLDSLAAVFWTLNLLYFSSGIFFVKMVVSRHVGKPEATRRVRDCVLYHSALPLISVAVGWIAGVPFIALLAVLPIVVRAFLGVLCPPARLSLKTIGYREVAYTVLFVLVMGLGFRLGA